MTDNRNHGRAPDKTQISLALPLSLLKQIEKIAIQDQRNRNNCIVKLLTDAVSEYKTRHRDEVGLRPGLETVESLLEKQNNKQNNNT